MCFASPFSTPPNALVMPAGTVYVYGLCQGRFAIADTYGGSDDSCIAAIVPVLVLQFFVGYG